MRINGVDENYSSEILEDLLKEMNYDSQRVAVELNKVVIPRADFSKTRLNKDDVLEIVHFVGGG